MASIYVRTLAVLFTSKPWAKFFTCRLMQERLKARRDQRCITQPVAGAKMMLGKISVFIPELWGGRRNTHKMTCDWVQTKKRYGVFKGQASVLVWVCRVGCSGWLVGSDADRQTRKAANFRVILWRRRTFRLHLLLIARNKQQPCTEEIEITALG